MSNFNGGSVKLTYKLCYGWVIASYVKLWRQLVIHIPNSVIGLNPGLPWCVKYTERGPPVTTQPDGDAGGVCGDRRPEGHVFHRPRQATIKSYYSTSIRQNMVQNCSYFTQIKTTATAIDDSNRQRNKIRLGCSRGTTAPLILIFKLLFRWLHILKDLLIFTIATHQNILAQKYHLVINIFRTCKIIIT